MASIDIDAPGTEQLLIGNEAIARGALEAGIGFAAAYPGTPSSEIVGSLAPIAKKMGIYAEWSVNEKVAMEAAAGTSFAGIRACPGLIWDKTTGKSKIDEVICTGCGVCADICPQGAIIKEAT